MHNHITAWFITMYGNNIALEYDATTTAMNLLLSIMCYVAVAPKLVAGWCIIDE